MPKNAKQKLDDIAQKARELEAQKALILQKALTSDKPVDIVTAMQHIQNQEERPPAKSFFIDPLEYSTNLGFLEKGYSLSYTTLKRMSKTPIINAIIKTRKNQVATYALPQTDKYATGFVIEKKGTTEEQRGKGKQDRTAKALCDFLLQCGWEKDYKGDDFENFLRKMVEDTLIFDQMCFEVVRNRRGQIQYFIAVDASTFRIADTYYELDKSLFTKKWFVENTYNTKKTKPCYVQIYNQAKVSEFYFWELCFGVRNPSTSIYSNGYGCSELEDLIRIVTSLLNSEDYNSRFFSQGSVPKGLLRINGTNSQQAIQQFRQQWQSMLTGVNQAWKTPVVEADVEWIDLQKTHRDMEYTEFQYYLIKIACAIYAIDPVEIGFDLSRSHQNSSGLNEENSEYKHDKSKDKGLYPLLKFLQRKINDYLIEPIAPDYEFKFVGVNQTSLEEELQLDIQKVQNFMTVNEIRKKYDLPPIEGGDIPLNPIFGQQVTQDKQLAHDKEQRDNDRMMQAMPYFKAETDADVMREYLNKA